MNADMVTFELAEVRKRDEGKSENISVNIDIPHIDTPTPSSVRIYFIYTASYPPSDTYFKLGGYAVFSGSDVISAAREWVKEKKLTGELGEKILNSINYAASVNSIFMTRIFNLNPPISAPTLKLGATSSKPKKG